MIIVIFTLFGIDGIEDIYRIYAVVVRLNCIGCHAKITGRVGGNGILPHDHPWIGRTGCSGYPPAVDVIRVEVFPADMDSFTDCVLILILGRAGIHPAGFARGPDGAGAPIRIDQFRREDIGYQGSDDQGGAKDKTEVSGGLKRSGEGRNLPFHADPFSK